jgi:tRNA-dihydrouridine synthase
VKDFIPSIGPALVLAPMQNVTDLPFMRVIAKRGGPDWFVTEFFRIHSSGHLNAYVLRSIEENTTGKPIFAQLIGSDVDALVKAAITIQRYPIAGIDLNLGCPSPTVCGKNAGGGLLRSTSDIDHMIGKMREVITTRFTVKTRVGYHDEGEFYNLLSVFSKHQLDGLTIHGRTVMDRYATPVRPHCVKQAVDLLSYPVIANGNVINVSSGKRYLSLTGAAGLMIGRGAIRNPWIFDQIRSLYQGVEIFKPRASDLLTYISDLYHELAAESRDYKEFHHVQRMKKTMLYIVQGLGIDFEASIRRVVTENEFFQLCEHHLNHENLLLDVPPEKSKLFCGFQELLIDPMT